MLICCCLGVSCVVVDAFVFAGWLLSVIFLVLCIYLAVRGAKVRSLRLTLVAMGLLAPVAVWFVGEATASAVIADVVGRHEAIAAAALSQQPVAPAMGWLSRRYFIAAGPGDQGSTVARFRLFPFRIVDIDVTNGQVANDRPYD
jgi:hypothetical protein